MLGRKKKPAVVVTMPAAPITVVLPFFNQQRPALHLFLVPGGEADLSTGQQLYDWFISAEEWTPEQERAAMTELAKGAMLAEQFQKTLIHFFNQGEHVWPDFIRPSPNTIPIMTRDLAAYVWSQYGPPIRFELPEGGGPVATLFKWYTTLERAYDLKKIVREKTIWHNFAAEFSEDELARGFADQMKEQTRKSPIPCAYAEIPVMARDLARYVKAEYGPAQQ